MSPTAKETPVTALPVGGLLAPTPPPAPVKAWYCRACGHLTHAAPPVITPSCTCDDAEETNEPTLLWGAAQAHYDHATGAITYPDGHVQPPLPGF